jgi:hypothetical protein
MELDRSSERDRSLCPTIDERNRIALSKLSGEPVEKVSDELVSHFETCDMCIGDMNTARGLGLDAYRALLSAPGPEY